jgi:hypothetical protein
VKMRIGQVALNATIEISSLKPKPKIRSATGMIATAGMGRMASMVKSISRSNTDDSPSSTPMHSPMRLPSARPPRAAPSVSSVARASVPSSSA